ncbi:Uncharacterised protein [Serratia marcescens]|nr:Uncharacterised protein [Serratia marcescens]CUY98395.1 Uncharacterised protein [Serratia marcescens]CUZ28298.1 Uncharacterised protein [Serratia marcescens]CVB62290.1 Uncharacterised protein [Serratia marcescens]CVD00693.1 Uncharacterised protein [Serratia marcescens]
MKERPVMPANELKPLSDWLISGEYLSEFMRDFPVPAGESRTA